MIGDIIIYKLFTVKKKFDIPNGGYFSSRASPFRN